MTGIRSTQGGLTVASAVVLITLLGLPGCGAGTTGATETDHAKFSHQAVVLPHPRQKEGRRFSGKIHLGHVRVTADRPQVSVKKKMEEIRHNSPPARPKRPGGK